MGKETGISWTHHSFNPYWGCTPVSPGCDNCYAEQFDRRLGGSHFGRRHPRRVFGDKHWNEPLLWNRDAAKENRKEYVFCASMADVMDDEAPAGALDRLYATIDATPNLIWQLLTKRPHRYKQRLPERFQHANVWLGATAENQQFYDVRWRILSEFRRAPGWEDTPLWISYEPAIGPVTMRGFDLKPDWVIFGGESGSRRRPVDAAWAEAIQSECQEFHCAFFMKQMSAFTPAQGKTLIPAHLLIHEFPGARAE